MLSCKKSWLLRVCHVQARCLEEGTKGQGEEDERRGRRKSKRRDAVRDSEQVVSQGEM